MLSNIVFLWLLRVILYIWFTSLDLPALNSFQIGDNTLNELAAITLTSIIIIVFILWIDVPFPEGTFSKGDDSLTKPPVVTADSIFLFLISYFLAASETLKKKIEGSP